MTFTNILATSTSHYPHQLDPMLPPDTDRTDWGSGGWKGGKGSNPNSALSALTLLAFLFFLNILQSCLRDQIGQQPPVVVMMMPTTTESTETVRQKRDIRPGENYYKEETMSPTCQNWTELEISNLVHNQVAIYWSNNQFKPRRMIFKDKNMFRNNNKEVNMSFYNPYTHPDDLKKHISAKLIIRNESKQNEKGNSTKNGNDYAKLYNKKMQNFVEPILNVTHKSIWAKVRNLIFDTQKLNLQKFLCCNVMYCYIKKHHQKDEGHQLFPRISQIIRQLVSLMCIEPTKETCTNDLQTQCQNPLIGSIIESTTAGKQ